jgi:NADPH-dependent 2,4-dienoyl-CoA reductase/sulfur reductase-like enzyme/bacterioferritin-associated ferredoxin
MDTPQPRARVDEREDLGVTDLAVIGAGPAGLAAALVASDLELKVTLLDELPSAGGQYIVGQSGRNPHRAFSITERHGDELLRCVADAPIRWWPETLVWHLGSDLTLSLYRRGEVTSSLRAGAVILATGAREQVVPFPGWTLPGVMTVGAAQLLAKRHGLTPGKRVLVAGSGPLLLAAAVKLAELGVQVVGVLEATHPRAWLPFAPAAWRNWDRFGEGWRYLRAMRQAQIPYRFGRTIVMAEGEGHVERAITAVLDASGCPVPGSAETLPVDAICVSFGFVPNIELAQVAGAALRFEPGCGGWIPQLDKNGQTTVPGLFVVGEAARVAGAATAMMEGYLVGLAAACHVGAFTQPELDGEARLVTGRRRRQARFGAMLTTLFAPKPGLGIIMIDDTLICRCEEVTAGEVRAAIRQGAVTLDALKTRTRVGQGPCQGRTCGTILARMIAQETGKSAADAGLFRIRPPVKPVPVAALAGGMQP